MEVLRYFWKAFSLILIVYGYYLFYTFCLDTIYRFRSYELSQYISFFITILVAFVSVGIWYFSKVKWPRQ